MTQVISSDTQVLLQVTGDSLRLGVAIKVGG